MNRILLIEDDVELAETTREYLENFGFSLRVAIDGEEGWNAAVEDVPDVVLLDLMLPGTDGLALCRRLRGDARTAKLPILMLTARDGEADRVVGLEMGADDYLTKPYSLRELVARIRAILRRVEPEAKGDTGTGGVDSVSGQLQKEMLCVGSLEIDRSARLVQFQGHAVDLTATEFELLWLFASRPGQVLTREQLLDQVRGREFEIFDRSIDVHVSKLRKKLEKNPKEPRFIRTVWGVGYRFEMIDDTSRGDGLF